MLLSGPIECNHIYANLNSIYNSGDGYTEPLCLSRSSPSGGRVRVRVVSEDGGSGRLGKAGCQDLWFNDCFEVVDSMIWVAGDPGAAASSAFDDDRGKPGGVLGSLASLSDLAYAEAVVEVPKPQDDIPTVQVRRGVVTVTSGVMSRAVNRVSDLLLHPWTCATPSAEQVVARRASMIIDAFLALVEGGKVFLAEDRIPGSMGNTVLLDVPIPVAGPGEWGGRVASVVDYTDSWCFVSRTFPGAWGPK